MKQALAFTILLILGLIVQAQQIAVKSFRSLENDLDARASYPKEDKNGEKAALIKIVTNETGFEFDGGMIGIVASVQKTGEIWLYVPRGSKALTIKHPKFTLLRNYPYPQAIAAGEVYEMVLTTGRVVTTIEAPVIETQWLIITTDPAGADVYINDQPAGKTPYQNELPTGKYSWRVSKELYLNDAGIANLVTGGEKQVMNVKLKPDFGTLNITSVPENGARVSLNGIGTGKITPCSIEMVPSGDHSITLSLDMYETTTQKVSLAAGETKQLAVNMNPTSAQVTVTTEPAADIYINDQFKAKVTWQGRLNPGVYTFEARLDKYITATEKQTVIVGQPLNVKLSPTPKTGNLKIITTPFDANIRISGKEMGKTPVTLKNQLIGDYTVELSMTGYTTAYEKVTITEGQTAEISTTLVSQGGTTKFILASNGSTGYDSLSATAIAFLKNKEYEKAAVVFNKKINMKRATPMDYYNLGKVYYNLHDYENADINLAIFNNLQPDHIAGWVWRARSKSNIDSTSKLGLAKPIYEIILEKTKWDTLKYSKERIESYYYLAYFNFLRYATTKNKEFAISAVDYSNRVLAIDPKDEKALKAKQIIDICKKFIP